jgi:hypothetical protein
MKIEDALARVRRYPGIAFFWGPWAESDYFMAYELDRESDSFQSHQFRHGGAEDKDIYYCCSDTRWGAFPPGITKSEFWGDKWELIRVPMGVRQSSEGKGK